MHSVDTIEGGDVLERVARFEKFFSFSTSAINSLVVALEQKPYRWEERRMFGLHFHSLQLMHHCLNFVQ